MYDIFLDLCEAYDALDRDSCLEILAEYFVGPQAIHLLRRYWDRLTMATMAVGHYGLPFKVFCTVTQGEPLSPTIFNLFVDAVLRYWVTVVAATEEAVDPDTTVIEGFSWDVQGVGRIFFMRTMGFSH